MPAALGLLVITGPASGTQGERARREVAELVALPGKLTVAKPEEGTLPDFAT